MRMHATTQESTARAASSLGRASPRCTPCPHAPHPPVAVPSHRQRRALRTYDEPRMCKSYREHNRLPRPRIRREAGALHPVPHLAYACGCAAWHGSGWIQPRCATGPSMDPALARVLVACACACTESARQWLGLRCAFSSANWNTPPRPPRARSARSPIWARKRRPTWKTIPRPISTSRRTPTWTWRPPTA